MTWQEKYWNRLKTNLFLGSVWINDMLDTGDRDKPELQPFWVAVWHGGPFVLTVLVGILVIGGEPRKH
jgi:hypothetical protein